MDWGGWLTGRENSCLTGFCRATLELSRRGAFITVLSRCSLVGLFDPRDCSPPGSSVCGILKARIPEWVFMPFSGGSSPPRGQTRVSYVPCVVRRVLYHLRHLGSPKDNRVPPRTSTAHRIKDPMPRRASGSPFSCVSTLRLDRSAATLGPPPVAWATLGCGSLGLRQTPVLSCPFLPGAQVQCQSARERRAPLSTPHGPLRMRGGGAEASRWWFRLCRGFCWPSHSVGEWPGGVCVAVKNPKFPRGSRFLSWYEHLTELWDMLVFKESFSYNMSCLQPPA